jgi:hypothetical protein
VEQQSGPPSTDRTGDETRRTGRFTRDPDTSRAELEPDRPATEESRGEATPPEVLPVPEQPPGDAGEPDAEAAPIMSNLPHSRPQQRSEKRPAAKRPASRQASASKSGRKATSGRSRAAGAGRASGARSKAAASSRGRTSAPTAAAPERSEGIPARAIGTAVQIATAPLKLTLATTRRAGGLIRRGLRL